MKNTTQRLALVLVLLAGFWGPGVQALPIAVSSSLNLDVDAQMNSGFITDSDTASQGATLNTLSVSALASNSYNSGSGPLQTIVTSGSATAQWTSSAAGNVQFNALGWTTQNVANTAFAFTTDGTDWEYTFTADADGVFTVNWDVSLTAGSSGGTVGLNSFRLEFTGAPNTIMALGTTGTATRAVVAGNTYTVGIENGANVIGSLGTRDVHMDGLFNWTIGPAAAAAVPEPSMLALLGLGFGLVSLMRPRVARLTRAANTSRPARSRFLCLLASLAAAASVTQAQASVIAFSGTEAEMFFSFPYTSVAEAGFTVTSQAGAWSASLFGNPFLSISALFALIGLGLVGLGFSRRSAP